jgi:hypothetical protein
MLAFHPSDVKTECEILLPLVLLGTRYESNIFGFSPFLLLKEVKARKQ